MGWVNVLGPKKYQARWNDPSGKPKSMVFSRKYDAERHLIAMEHAKHSGTYIDISAGKVTVAAMADEWLASKINLKPSTRVRYRSALDVHVLPRWGTVPLSKITHGELRAWLAKMQADGQAAASIIKVHNVMSAILDLAVRDRRLAVSPADGIELPKGAEKPRRYLTEAQVAELADSATALRTDRPRRATDASFGQYRLVVLTLAYCGLRWSEIAALKVKRVDLMRRRLHIVEAVVEVNGARIEWGTPKDHEQRWVPVPKFLADELLAHLVGKTKDDLVFTSPGGDVMRNRNARRAWFDRAASAIGMEGLTPHELRHTAASLAVRTGSNVKAVQRMLGHASAAMTLDTYADLFDDDLDAMAGRLDALFWVNAERVSESTVNVTSLSDLQRSS